MHGTDFRIAGIRLKFHLISRHRRFRCGYRHKRVGAVTMATPSSVMVLLRLTGTCHVLFIGPIAFVIIDSPMSLIA